MVGSEVVGLGLGLAVGLTVGVAVGIVVGWVVVGAGLGDGVGASVGAGVAASSTGAQQRQLPQSFDSEPVNTLQLMPLCRMPVQPSVMLHSSAHSAIETAP